MKWDPPIVLASIREQLAERPPLRLAAWLALALILLHIIFQLADLRQSRLPELQRLVDRHARLEQVLEVADWADRFEAARARVVELENRFWNAESRGLARAELEAVLSRQADLAGLVLRDVEVGGMTEIEAIPGLERLEAQIQADPDPEALVRFLAALADSDRNIEIDAFRFGGQRRAQSVIDLHAIFRVASSVESG